MQVLVVESEAGAATVAVAQLQAAGHRVMRCHEPGAPAFPCAGLEPGGCPLEHDAIDVVLTVRSRAQKQPSPLEDGVTCALRQRTPVVVAGRTTPNAFEQFPVTMAELDVVAACERAATGPQLEHERVALTALEETLGHSGLAAASAGASVHRSGEGLRVALHVPAATPRPVRDTAVVRVVGALRAFDPHAPKIDVTCEENP